MKEMVSTQESELSANGSGTAALFLQGLGGCGVKQGL
jgi:hypothetical protein